MEIIFRQIQKRIEKWLFQNKIIILYGARQVGKTTLAKIILKKYKQKKSLYINCEDLDVQNLFAQKNIDKIKFFLGDASLIVLDEAQSIFDIGIILKLLHDKYPEIQIIATGSSSFDLSGKINEPLTGRSLEFKIYPLSIQEIAKQKNPLFIQSNIDKFLMYGMYPEIFEKNNKISEELVLDLAKKYLFKDVLLYAGIKNSNLIYKILKALAYQIGNQISYPEIANLVGSNKNTVEKYIDILEKSFVIFRLPAFCKNKRNEIKKSQKIYFYDIGIRNALINNFGNLDLRNDRGHIWENFIIVEILKNHENNGIFSNFYFWRTYTQLEIDLIIEKNNFLSTFEIKINSQKKYKIPKYFKENYPNHSFDVINKENFLEKIFPSSKLKCNFN